MPETAPPRRSAPLGESVRLFLGVAVLNALLAFPVLYQTYKHFSTEQTPMDVAGYAAMVEDGPEAVGSPFRYRVLAPLLVRAMDVLPGYGIPVDYAGDPASPQSQKVFFHFLLLNFLLIAAASALLFLYLRARVRDPFAWAGSLLYLFGFFTVTAGLIPMTDAACHLAIAAAILCFDRRKPRAFLLACLIGVFAKETLLIVLLPWIAVHAVGSWKRLGYVALLLPALAAYVALTLWMPVAADYAFYDPAYLLRGALRVFDPSLYDRSFFFHAALGHLPLIAALAGWAWLRAARGTRLPVDRGLAVFGALLWLGAAMGIGNNAARLAFMAFPAVALFEARVLQGLWEGRHRAAG